METLHCTVEEGVAALCKLLCRAEHRPDVRNALLAEAYRLSVGEVTSGSMMVTTENGDLVTLIIGNSIAERQAVANILLAQVSDAPAEILPFSGAGDRSRGTDASGDIPSGEVRELRPAKESQVTTDSPARRRILSSSDTLPQIKERLTAGQALMEAMTRYRSLLLATEGCLDEGFLAGMQYVSGQVRLDDALVAMDGVKTGRGETQEPSS